MCLNKEISVSIAFRYLLMRYDIVADCTSFAVNQVVKCVKKQLCQVREMKVKNAM